MKHHDAKKPNTETPEPDWRREPESSLDGDFPIEGEGGKPDGGGEATVEEPEG